MSPTMVVSSATTTFLVNQFSCCPSCGFDIGPLENDPSTRLLESQARIVELETQVCLLNQRANAAIGRWAEYEAELAKLRAQIRPSSSSTSTSTISSSAASSASASSTGTPAAARASLFQSGASRLSALVYSRSRQVSGGSAAAAAAAAAAAGGPSKSSGGVDSDLGGKTEATPTPASASAVPMTAKATATTQQENLREALEREQSLRRAAEKRLSATSKEVEELSAALFEQANEMVADERRARARLEQRVGELEKRDVDKKRRLDRLETAMGRIERARLLLSQGPQSDPLLPGHSEP